MLADYSLKDIILGMSKFEIPPAGAELKNSYFLTPELAQQAIAGSEEAIQALIDNGTFAKPEMFYAIAIQTLDESGSKSFDILAEKVRGDQETWEYPYDEFALNKINISARTGMSVSQVLEEYPHLLLEGDVIYPGALTEKGVIAGCSSIEDGDKDELVCPILLDNLFRLIHEAKERKLAELAISGAHKFE